MAIIDEAAVRTILKRVLDPEIGIDVVELGLVYGIEASEDVVRVRLTLTSAACPMGEMLVEDAERALEEGLPPGTFSEIELVWEPPWSPAKMSESARRTLGWEA